MRICSVYIASKTTLTILLSTLLLFSAVSESGNKRNTSKTAIYAGAAVVTVAGIASFIYFYSKNSQPEKEAEPAQTSGVKKIKPLQHPEEVAIVLDFDRCLMRENYCYPHRITPIDQIEPLEKDFGLESPQTDLNSLLDNTRVRLAIASFGRKDIINKALDQVINKEHRDKIIVKTPQDVGGRDWYHPNPANKNKMLEQIAQETGIPFTRMILFDDNKNNLHAAKKIGVETQHAEPFDENSLNIAKGFIHKN